MSVDGFLIVDKPSGVTSFSMVSLVRRLTGVKRVGHAGTLDPLASGVLPVAVGKAARFIEYLDDAAKTYVARVRFGAATDTYDAEGSVTSAGDASGITEANLREALTGFVGEIAQVPPLYSAIKLDGKPLYSYARQGADVSVTPRTVRIDVIELLSSDLGPSATGEAELRVRCGKGTYIRSLAHDLGQLLGCGAHLAALSRTSSGGFSIEDARSPEDLRALDAEGRLEEAILAPDRAVERRPAVILDPAHSEDVMRGRDVDLPADADRLLARAYADSGEFLGVLRGGQSGRWHPEKVLSRS